MAMSAQEIIDLYKKHLGRTPSDAEVEGWTSESYGSDPASQIPNSGEAKEYAKTHPPPYTPAPTPGGGGGQNYPGDPSSPTWAHDQVAAAYKQYLGREMSEGEWHQYWKGKPVGDSIRQIGMSQEAQNWAKSHPAGSDTTGGGGDKLQRPTGGKISDRAYLDKLIAWAQQQEGVNPSVKNDPDYWRRRVSEGAFGEDEEYLVKRFMQAEGKPESGGGNANLSNLASYLTNSPLLKPWTTPFTYPTWQAPPAFTPPADFVAPDRAAMEQDPGYQFRVEQGQKGIERSAAARGTLLSGGTLKDLEDYRQGLASQEYGQVYGRKLQDWTTNYNKALTDYQTLYNADMTDWTTNFNKAIQEYQQSYNIFENNQAKQYNRISNLAGLGQTAAGQLGQGGLGYAQLNSNILGNNARTLADIFTGQGNAGAAGTIGGANAWGNLFGNYGDLAGLFGLFGGGGQRPPNASSFGDFPPQGPGRNV